MNLLRQLLILSTFITCTSLLAQTNITAGSVSGTWQKSGSPYKVAGNIYVAKGQSLTITEGVTIEFQDTWKMDVYGKIAVLGKPGDTVVFTAKDKVKGWKGLRVYGQNSTDTFRIWYGKFEYFKTQEQYYLKSRSVLKIDSVSGLVDVLGCRFTRNHGVNNAGLNVNKSNLRLKNSGFDNNLSSDLRSSNVAPSSGSAAVLRNCEILIDSIYVFFNKCYSLKNSNDTSSLLNGSSGNFIVWDCNGNFKNSRFWENYAAARGSAIQFSSTLLRKYILNIDNLIIEENSSYQGAACLFIYAQSGSADKIKLNNCVFRNNYITDWLFKPGFYYRATDFITFNNSAELYLDKCLFQNSFGDMSCGFNMSNVYSSNSRWLNNNAVAISYTQGGNNIITNSIVSNNGAGLIVDGTTLKLYNTNITNNTPSSIVNAKIQELGYGVTTTFSGGIELTNSIVWGNRHYNGDILNFFVDAQNPKATNCIIEGNYDSIKYSVNVSASKPTTWINVLDTNPQFVNPTAGAGLGYDASLADWHLKNTCAFVSPGFDAGVNNYGIVPVPQKDLDGNPRKVGSNIDIGPYEIQNPNAYTRISKEPKDTSFCEGITGNGFFGTSVTGNNLQYRWQHSVDSTSGWADINGQTGSSMSNYSTSNVGANYFRLIALNTTCNKADTSRITVLYINPNPKPNLGSDTTLANSGSKVLNPGTFNSYSWSTGANSATLTVDKTNLNVGVNSIWVEVTDSKTCKGRDTVVITLEPANGLNSPGMVGIKIYPVPLTDVLTIQLPDGLEKSQQAVYQILTMDGRIVQAGRLDKDSKIHVSTLSVGSYILSLNIEGKIYGVKILK